MANLIDPNIALQVKPYTPPDYSQTLGNALTLKSGIQQSQATDRDIQNQQMLKDLWAKADTTTPEGQADFVKKAAAIDPKAAVAARQNFSKEAETQASIGEKKAAAAQHFATAQKDIEQTQASREQREADAFTQIFNEADADLKQFDNETKNGALPVEVSKRIGEDMKALVPKFEQYADILPPGMLDKMKTGQFNAEDVRKALPMLKAHADQKTLIAQQKADAETARVANQGQQPTPFEKEAGALYGTGTEGYKKALAAHVARLDAPPSYIVKAGADAAAKVDAGKPLSENDQFAMDTMAWNYINTGKLPYRKGAGGGKDKNDQIVKAASSIAESLGMTPQELAGKSASFKADAASLSFSQKKLDSIQGTLDSFHNNLDTWDNLANGLAPKIGGDRAKAIQQDLHKIDFTGVRSLDDWKLKVEQQFNDPTASAIAVAAMSAAMDYARIMQGPMSNAALTESARKDAERLISVSADEKGRRGIMAALDSDTAGQVKGLSDQVGKIQTRISGKTPEKSDTKTVHWDDLQ